jgi:hypothetical protein
MGWKGKIFGALLGGVPGAIIGDVLDGKKKTRTLSNPDLSDLGTRAGKTERSLTKEEWGKRDREERLKKRG